MIEANDRPTVRRAMMLFPRLLGIAVQLRRRAGRDPWSQRVERSCSSALAEGRPLELACDGVLLTGRFLPEAALVRSSHLELDPATGGPAVDQYGRCTDPAYFAAGNLLRPVETAGWSFREGTRIGGCVADDLAGTAATAVHRARDRPRPWRQAGRAPAAGLAPGARRAASPAASTSTAPSRGSLTSWPTACRSGAGAPRRCRSGGCWSRSPTFTCRRRPGAWKSGSMHDQPGTPARRSGHRTHRSALSRSPKPRHAAR